MAGGISQTIATLRASALADHDASYVVDLIEGAFPFPHFAGPVDHHRTISAGAEKYGTSESSQLAPDFPASGLSPEVVDSIGATSGDDTITGTAGDDTIVDAWGDDIIDGGDGDDTIIDLGGSNTIHGGLGKDYISLTASDLDSTPYEGVVFHDGDTGATNMTADVIRVSFRYQEVRGNTYVYADLDGDGHSDVAIMLGGTHALTSGDFVL